MLILNRRARPLAAGAGLIAITALISVASGKADPTPTITITPPAGAIAEGGSGTFTVELTGGDANVEYPVQWALAPGAANSAGAADFKDPVSGGLTLKPAANGHAVD